MSRPEKEIIERLGADGLTRALADLLDQNRLVRLANSCGLKYPGMRTRSQSRERILADLVQRAGEDASSRRAVIRALQKETRATARQWTALSAEEKQQRIEDDAYLLSNGQLARHLFLLASSGVEGDHDRLRKLLDRQKRLGKEAPSKPRRAPSSKPDREIARLNRRLTELQKKVQHLESQLAKSRDADKKAKRDLIQRKGDLAEARMLNERLRSEVDEFREQARRAGARQKQPPAPDTGVTQLTKAIRQLTNQQKKVVHGIDTLASSLPPVSAEPSGVDLRPVLEALAGLREEQIARRREAKRESAARVKRDAELLTRIDGIAEQSKPAPRVEARPGAERVGVFIDVQNMYYGARQLKGKLDFDALMRAAVRERRLIQATAYVVESSEIDQSGFIAILRKRAIDVRRKTLQVRADGSMKGDWDMELALDVLDAAAGLDVVVLVSGDGDFTSLVQRVKRMGPRVEVIGFPRNTAKSLLEAADQFQPLNRKFMIYPDKPKSRKARAPAPPKKRVTAKSATAD